MPKLLSFLFDTSWFEFEFYIDISNDNYLFFNLNIDNVKKVFNSKYENQIKIIVAQQLEIVINTLLLKYKVHVLGLFFMNSKFIFLIYTQSKPKTTK